MDSRQKKSSVQIIFGIATAAIAWFAVIMQAYLRTGSFANFLSYFTVLCNLLIAVSLTLSLLLPSTKAGQFFSRTSVQTAIALYILIVGLVYNLVLRGIWAPTGWQLVVDNLLHVLVPVLYLLYWILFVPRTGLTWQDGIYWLWFPLIYLVYSLVRGPVAKWYPYPFLDVAKLGYGKVFINIAMMIGVFLIAGLLLIALARPKKTGVQARV